MTFTSIFWTTDGTGHGISGGYTQALLLDWMRRTMLEDGANQCILPSWLGECAVTNPSGKTIRVASGAGYADGFPFENNANVDLTPSTPASLARVDRVVIRANWTAQTVDAFILEGSEGAGVPPAVTQSSGTTWEVSLATYEISTGAAISDLTDTREFIHFNTRVATAMLDAESVTDAKLRDSAAASVIGRAAASAGVPADIAIAANQVLGRLAAGIVAGQVQTAQVANNAIDDTKAGDRVPQLYRRQGGSSTIWSTVGSSNYTPGAVRIQCGSISVASPGSRVTFPTAFAYAPIVFLQPLTDDAHYAIAYNLTTTYFDSKLYDDAGAASSGACSWMAIGPE